MHFFYLLTKDFRELLDMINKEDISEVEITTFKAKVIITITYPSPSSPKVDTH